ncbi:MAG: GAF domain-containing sensor histidine kinase [Caldisericales bacterium]|nr:GAF domain-containing sensor histidine kinase [Caldisericales bacterium]
MPKEQFQRFDLRECSRFLSGSDALINLRWIAAVALLVASAAIWLFLPDLLAFPLLVISFLIIFFNIFLYYFRSFCPDENRFFILQVICDWVFLFFVCFWTGSISSPAVFMFPVYSILVGFFLPRKHAYLVSGSGAILIGLLSLFSSLPPLAYIIGQSFFYIVVLFFCTTIGIWASRQLREQLDLSDFLRKSLEKENGRLGQVYKSALLMNSGLDLSNVLSIITKCFNDTDLSNATVIRLLSEDGLTLDIASAEGISSEYAQKGSVALKDDQIDSEAIKCKCPVFVGDVTKDERFLYKSEAERENLQSLLCIPLFSNERSTGVIRCYTSSYHEFSDEEVEFLSLLATQASLAISNAVSYDKMVRMDNSRNAFIRMATHELRAPMAAVQSVLQIILDGYVGDVPENQKQLLSRSNDRITQLLRLVSELLELEKTSKSHENFEPINLKELISRVISEIAPKADSKKVRLRLFTCGDNIIIKGVEEALFRIFENLVDNAVKYTHSNGQVTIRLLEDDETSTVQVVDNGIGIPADSIPKLFSEFYRAPNAKLEQVQGTGLGLSIVRKFVVMHGGSISVSSQVNVGTTFTVVLPKEPLPATR